MDKQSAKQLLDELLTALDPDTGELFVSSLQDEDIIFQRKLIKLTLISCGGIQYAKKDSENKLGRPWLRIYDELRQWRNEYANNVLHQKPYFVFSNADLENIAKGDVVEKEDLLLFVKGISYTRYRKYADDIFNILKPYIGGTKDPTFSGPISLTQLDSEETPHNAPEEPQDAKTCNSCRLFDTNQCPHGGMRLCDDYEPAIILYGKEFWPTHGDATSSRIEIAIRRGGRST